MLERRDIARVRSEVVISALQSAAVHLGSIKEGRKSIIFVSEGLTGLGLFTWRSQGRTETAKTTTTANYILSTPPAKAASAQVCCTSLRSTRAHGCANTPTCRRAR